MRWKFRQFWSSGNREFLVSVMPFFDLYFDGTGKRLNGGISMIQDGSGKICFNLSLFDRLTGGRIYDFVAQNELA